MIDIVPEEIMEWNTNKLWNTIQILINEEETNINQKEYEQVKQGIRIKIPIWYIIQEWYEPYPSSRKIQILGYGKYKIEDFMEEKDERNRIMRKILLENLPDNPTGPRT